MKRFYALAVTALLVTLLISGEISGTISSIDNGDNLIGANINVIDQPYGAATDLFGNFSIQIEKLPVQLLITHIGYESKSIEIMSFGNYDIALKEKISSTEKITIREERTGNHSDRFGQVYGAELMKQKRETSADLGSILSGIEGMQMNMCCALDNSTSLSLLGLPGAYTEITIDGAPEICGLASNYRLYSYPAIGIEQISIKKGPVSARSQAKSLGGHVNIVTGQPREGVPEGSISVYARSVGGYEMQGEIASQINNIGSQFAVSILNANEFDKDGDGWTESPAKERYFTRFKLYFDEIAGIKTRISGLYLDEEVTGGMANSNRIDHGRFPFWVKSVHTNRFESTFELEYPIHKGSIDFNTTVATVGFDEIIDTTQNIVTEEGIITQIGYKSKILGGNFYSGLSYRYEQINDNADILDRDDNRFSLIAEHSMIFNDNLSAAIGLRSDRDDDGSRQEWSFHPRMSLEYKPRFNITTTLRLGSGGRFRPSVQDLMEGYDQAISIEVPPDLERESGLSGNFSLEWKLYSDKSTYTINAMAYKTQIKNRLIPYSAEEGILSYQNADGLTDISGIESGLNAYLPMDMEAHLGFDLTQTSFENAGIKSELPFTPQYRAFGRYIWPDIVPGWKIVLETMLYGPQKLPENAFGIEESEIFSTTSMATSIRTGPILIGFKISNIFNEIQSIAPVQGTADPFVSGVSSDLVYGPLVGRTFAASLVYHFGRPGDVLKGLGFQDECEDGCTDHGHFEEHSEHENCDH